MGKASGITHHAAVDHPKVGFNLTTPPNMVRFTRLKCATAAHCPLSSLAVVGTGFPLQLAKLPVLIDQTR